MFEQAAALALVAAFYPPAMLIAALYLASARPGRVTALYLVGGTVIVTVVGTAALLVIRDAGLSLASHHSPRYGLRLALGALAIVAAAVIWQRRPPEPAPGQARKPGLIDRLSAEPRPRTAFLVGIVMFGPSITFIAAVQVVATSKASVAATVGAMAMIIVLTVSFAWIPLVAYLLSPERTTRGLHTFETWLRRHGRTVLACAVGVIGLVLMIQGITGLA